MRLHSLAILCASASLIAVPAFAQGSNQTNEPAATANHGENPHAGTYPRQALMKDLQKAGFSKIRIEPEAFIVHAVNSQGEPVLMRITPDSMEAVTAMKASGPQTSASNKNDQSGGQSSVKTE